MLRTLPLLLMVAACGRGETPAANEAAAPTAAAEAPAAPQANAAGQEEAVTPVEETPSDDRSGETAAQVLETYYALIDAGRFDEAWELRWPGAGNARMTKEEFAARFAPYAEYRATVGMPGTVSGAAGSLYVEVPVQIYGRMKDGKPFGSAGTVTLRRVNDVPGSTEAERRWRIYANG